jgi:hypothetical protein
VDKHQLLVKIGKSASETLTLLILAFGEYIMKNLRVFDWHRRFEEGLPKMQRTDANVDRVRTLVCSD